MGRQREKDYLLTTAKKRRLKAKIKAEGLHESRTVTANRKFKRAVRKQIRNGTFRNNGLDLPKPGKFISDRYLSSGRFKSAYSFARSEQAFYDDAFYADY